MPRRAPDEVKTPASRGWTWGMTLTERHIEELRSRLAAIGSQWDKWEYKPRAGSIIVYTSITPWNPKTGRPDPALRYMAKHLRIVCATPGPFQLEYRRHTEQWSPLPCEGSIEEIAKFIATDPCGLCAPPEP